MDLTAFRTWDSKVFLGLVNHSAGTLGMARRTGTFLDDLHLDLIPVDLSHNALVGNSFFAHDVKNYWQSYFFFIFAVNILRKCRKKRKNEGGW